MAGEFRAEVMGRVRFAFVVTVAALPLVLRVCVFDQVGAPLIVAPVSVAVPVIVGDERVCPASVEGTPPTLEPKPPICDSAPEATNHRRRIKRVFFTGSVLHGSDAYAFQRRAEA